MLTFAQLVRKVTSSGATEVRLVADKPILVAKGSSHRELGEPLSSQQILTMVNKSLPQDVTEGFRWGKEVKHRLDFDGVPWIVRVILKSKEDVRVQLRNATDEPTTGDLSRSQLVSDDSMGIADPTPDPLPTKPLVAGTRAAVSQTHAFTAEQTKTVRAFTEGGGERIALIYGELGKSPTNVNKALEKLDLKPKGTTDSAVALEALRYNDFPVIVLSYSSDFSDDPVYLAIRDLPWSRRLKTMVVVVAPNVRTGDRLLAFSLSVNLVVNRKNVKHFQRLTSEALAFWNRFIEPYETALARQQQP